MSGDLTYPGSPYRVLAHDPEADPPKLPDGHGAVAVHTWCPPAAQRYTLAPIVGVDGEPASYGWGHALVVLPAGEHLVEVQYVEPMRTVPVTVAAGQIVPVEYAAALDGTSPGALGRRAQRPPGRAFNPLGYGLLVLAVLAGYLVGLGVARAAGLSVGAAGLVVGILAVVAAGSGGVAVYRHQQRSARRRRRGSRTRRAGRAGESGRRANRAGRNG